jgi:hypothetical protein
MKVKMILNYFLSEVEFKKLFCSIHLGRIEAALQIH